MTLIEALMETGLTRHESKLYIALCSEGELTGYEAAKVSGIPRANTYQALAGLVDKGGAYIIEGEVQRYTAIPVDEYCVNVVNHIKEITQKIQRDCPQQRKPAESYITITGAKNIVNKMKNIINHATERIYISIPESQFENIKKELEQAINKGLKVVAIASNNFNMPGLTTYIISNKSNQVRLIADSTDVLTGDISGSSYDTCLFSKNKPLVELIKDALKNEIKLAQIEDGKEG